MICKLLTVSCLSLLAACSVPMRAFEFRAIDNRGSPVKCLVIIDRKWPKTKEEREQAMFTDGEYQIVFNKPKMNIIVQPARIVNGEVQIPEPTEIGEYLQDQRDIVIDDPRIHLFIVNRNANFSDF
jgi:hypothetical protein